MTLFSKNNTSDEGYYRYGLLTATIIVFLIHALSIFYSKLPIVESDEFAYISAAKYIAGWDKIDKIPDEVFTGSIGYPAIISPAFMISNDPVTSYRLVLLINSLFASLMLPLLYLIGKQIFNLDGKLSLLIAIATSLFPSSMLQSNVAWTQTASTTLFTWSILMFHRFLTDKDTKSQIFFIVSVFLASAVHVRGLAVISAMLIILVLFFISDKKSRVKIIITSIVLVGAYLVSLSLADSVGSHIVNDTSGASIIISKLASRFEIILFGGMFVTIFVMVYKKYFTALSGLVIAVIIGFLSSLNILFYGLVPLALIGIILLRIFQKIGRLEFLLATVLFALSMIIEFLLLKSIVNYLNAALVAIYWITNLSAKIYYLFTASFIISGLGMVGIIIIAIKGIKSSENMAREWVYVFITFAFAVTLFMINSQTKLDADYRPERLFYGRYIEMFIPIFMVAGFSFLLEGFWKKKNVVWWNIVAFVTPLILIPLVYRYNFVSEPEFRNFFSFFPYKAVFHSINLFLIASIALVIFALTVFILQKKAKLSIILYSGMLFSLSTFIFVYVIIYHQDERQANTRIAAVLQYLSPKDTVDYDMRIQNAGMPNKLIYQYLLHGVEFDFVDPNRENIFGNFLIGTPYYMELNNPNAVLIASERSSYDCLWLTKDFNNKKYLPFMPSYLDLNIFDEAVLGVYKKGFDEDNSLRSEGIISIPNFRGDTYDSLFISAVAKGETRAKSLKIKINDSEVTTIDFDSNSLIEKSIKLNPTSAERIKIECLIDSENSGIVFKSLVFKGKYNEIPLADFAYNGQVAFDTRDNFNLNRIQLHSGKSFSIPMQFYSIRDRGGIGSVVVSWKDFILQRVSLKQNVNLSIQHDNLLDVSLTAPTKPGKYFLEFSQDYGSKIPLLNMFGKNYYLVVVEP